MLDRRQALRLAALGGVAPLAHANAMKPRVGGDVGSDPNNPIVRLTPFITPLPIPPSPPPGDPFRPSDLAAQNLAFLGPVAGRAQFTTIVEEEAMISLHPELPKTPVWRYRSTNMPEDSPFLAGPTFVVRQGTPQVVRFINDLPANHVGFGVPHTTTHFHGGHIPPVFDGFPENVPDLPHIVREHGESFDYVWPQQDVGFTTGNPDRDERPALQWYHDHLLDFTGPNVMRGMAGLYIVFDGLDTGDETRGLRLPSGPFDIPLVLQDKRMAPDGTMIYQPDDFDGFLGDQMLVNGAIYPFLEVKRRKYRFRLLNGSNARMYKVRITDENNRNPKPLHVIGNDGGLLSRTCRKRRTAFLGMAERLEVIVDFSRFPEGTELYLTNFIKQDSGRGPDGDSEDVDEVPKDQAVKLMKFIVTGGEVRDRSVIPDTLRPIRPVPQDMIDNAVHRHFKFERTGGAWAINGEFIDIEHPSARPKKGQPEIWHIENGGGGWWHPIHVHIELGRVLSRNGQRPGPLERDGNAKKDTVNLAGGDEAQVYFNFRDFTGPTVFHCHNIEHEDHFMMARFDIEENTQSTPSAPDPRMNRR